MSFRLGLGLGLGAKGRGGLASETSAFLARVQTQSPAYRTAYDTLIKGLKADGLWPIGDACSLVRCHDPITARTNIFSANWGLTEVSAPTFTPDSGYTGAAAKYLTGYNPSTAGGHFSQNSFSIGAWLSNAGAAPLIGLFGVGPGAGARPYLDPKASGQLFWGDGADNTLAIQSPATDDYLVCRTASNALVLYKDGIQIGTASTVSQALINSLVRFLDDGFNDYAVGCVLGPTWTGGALNAAQALALHNRLAAFMAAAPTAVNAAYDFYDDFSGPDMQMNQNRIPVYGSNPWVLTGSAIVADPTSIRAGAGKYYRTLNNGFSYAVMQCTATPSHISGVFESNGGAWSPTIACVKDYPNHGFSAMWHADLNQGTGLFAPGYWNDVWNGAGSSQVNVLPTTVTQDHTFALAANTRYREDVYIAGNTVTQTLTDMSGNVLASGVSTDTIVQSVIGPYVFFELSDNSTIWHEAWAK